MRACLKGTVRIKMFLPPCAGPSSQLPYHTVVQEQRTLSTAHRRQRALPTRQEVQWLHVRLVRCKARYLTLETISHTCPSHVQRSVDDVCHSWNPQPPLDIDAEVVALILIQQVIHLVSIEDSLLLVMKPAAYFSPSCTCEWAYIWPSPTPSLKFTSLPGQRKGRTHSHQFSTSYLLEVAVFCTQIPQQDKRQISSQLNSPITT